MMERNNRIVLLTIIVAVVANLVPDIPTAVIMLREHDGLSEVICVSYAILLILVFYTVVEL